MKRSLDTGCYMDQNHSADILFLFCTQRKIYLLLSTSTTYSKFGDRLQQHYLKNEYSIVYLTRNLPEQLPACKCNIIIHKDMHPLCYTYNITVSNRNVGFITSSIDVSRIYPYKGYTIIY